MKLIAVTYHYSSDSDEITRVRPEHREFLGRLYVKQILRASGPTSLVTEAGTNAGALLIVSAASTDDAVRLLEDDPFWKAGLIVKREAMEWNAVFGPWSSVS